MVTWTFYASMALFLERAAPSSFELLHDPGRLRFRALGFVVNGRLLQGTLVHLRCRGPGLSSNVLVNIDLGSQRRMWLGMRGCHIGPSSRTGKALRRSRRLKAAGFQASQVEAAVDRGLRQGFVV